MEDGSTKDGEKAGRSLSTGLNGWVAQVQAQFAAGASCSDLAAEYGLPLSYLQRVQEMPVPELSEAAADDSAANSAE